MVCKYEKNIYPNLKKCGDLCIFIHVGYCSWVMADEELTDWTFCSCAWLLDRTRDSFEWFVCLNTWYVAMAGLCITVNVVTLASYVQATKLKITPITICSLAVLYSRYHRRLHSSIDFSRKCNCTNEVIIHYGILQELLLGGVTYYK